MSDENSVRTDSREATLRVVEVVTRPLTRRAVLGTTASALAGGPLLATFADEAAAAPHDGGELDVRTTDIEILGDGTGSREGDGGEEGKIRTTGQVSGMSNYDCERCEVGAQVRPVGDDRWYGGLQTVEHTHRDSFRIGVTLAGLHPGKYECRLCACPITHTDLFVANVLIVVVTRGDRHERKKKKKKKHRDEKKHHEKKKRHDEKKRHDKKKHHGKKKFEKAYREQCPCSLQHPGRYHLMICGGDAHTVREYAFQVSSHDVHQVGVSNAPDVVSSRHVTLNGEVTIDGTAVTGAVAGGSHSFVCGGELTGIRVAEGASVYVNGSNVTKAARGY